jgi:predicted ATPase
MKICYIWVENFRNLENFGFNLSSTFKFIFDRNKNRLTRKSFDKLPDNFFGENVSDVIGIIGKNGSGKSNVVELVCKMLKGAKTSLQTNFFLIVEENGNLICKYSLLGRKHPEADFNIHFEDYSGNINPLKVVYFSNVFDERLNNFDKEVADISVNNLFGRGTLFRRYKTSDFEKQINLINSGIFSTLNIELPTKVQLTSRVWVHHFNSSMEREVFRESYKNIMEFKTIFRDRIRSIKPENKFIHLFRFGFFFEFFNNYSRRGIKRTEEPRYLFENISQVISNLIELRSTEEITENLIIYLEKELSFFTREKLSQLLEIDIKNRSYSSIEDIYSQIDFVKSLKYSIGSMNIEYSSEGSRNRELEYFTFNFNPSASKDFINKFIKLFAYNSFFNINWMGISSGHKAYLNLFASLFNELKKSKHTNLLLCIDEGDLYLHPKWQIEFFDKLLAVLPTIFFGNIQLILTSHSPFLLSDLPKQNITILENETPVSPKDGIELKINTFGGNLYNLYSEPFFLGRKRTSDFAYNKIKSLIEKVEKKELSKQDKISALKIANILGDEIIQFQIKKQLGND